MAATTTSTMAFNAAAPPDQPTFRQKVFARVRLAEESDVPHLHKLMYKMSSYHKFAHVFNVTESSISDNLFKSNPAPPFHSITVLILEVSSSPFETTPPNSNNFNPTPKTFNLDDPIVDSESEDFVSSSDNVIVAGYLLFFPFYTAYFAKPGYYMENIFVRECYRKKGIGGMLFSSLASHAASTGLSTIAWRVATWNVDSIDFYLKKGARVMNDFVHCSLNGDALSEYADMQG